MAYVTDPASKLKEFLSFLWRIWGGLSTISLLFPFSNSLAKVLPISNDETSLFTILATIFSVFVLFLAYVTREIYIEHSDGKKLLRRQAYISIGLGSLAIFVYLFLYVTYHPVLSLNESFTQWMMWSVGFVSYTLIFAALTNAFTRLALSEYLFGDQIAGNEESLSNPTFDFENYIYGPDSLQGSNSNITRDLLRSKVSAAINKECGRYTSVKSISILALERNYYSGRDKISLGVHVAPMSLEKVGDLSQRIKRIVGGELDDIGLVTGEIKVEVDSLPDLNDIFNFYNKK